MANPNSAMLGEILRDGREKLAQEWMRRLHQNFSARTSLLKKGELEEQGRDFLTSLDGFVKGGGDFRTAEGGAPAREFLGNLSRSRARQGFTPSETAMFVLSLKEPLFLELRSRLQNDPVRLAEETWNITHLLDTVGLYTIETYMKGREEVISRQQQELLELSTPVVRLWDGVLALPLIGTLDSARTQVVMESLLQAIVETGSMISIIDITGVPVVDTLVAQHLLKTVAAARLMGADCIISGIRPQIAQTIVHLGVNIGDVITKATLADAFAVALTRIGMAVVRRQKDSNTRRPVAGDGQ
jgi:rsbT co-antagonist protein RsbR